MKLTTRISKWARQGGVQTTVQHHGRLLTALDNACIALSWMSRGGQYDDRNLRARLVAGNFYWKAAAHALFK